MIPRSREWLRTIKGVVNGHHGDPVLSHYIETFAPEDRWRDAARERGLLCAARLPDLGIWKVPEEATAVWAARRDAFMADPAVVAACRQWMTWSRSADLAALIVGTGPWRSGVVHLADGIDLDRSPLVSECYRAAGR